MHIRPGEGQDGHEPKTLWRPAPGHNDPLDDGEQEDSDQLWTHGQDLNTDQVARERQQRRGHGARAGGAACKEHEERDRSHDEPPGHRDPVPTSSPPDPGQEDLGRPLLVQPRVPSNGEREKVRAEEMVSVQHEPAGPHLIRKVNSLRATEPRRSDGESDGDRGPQSVEREARSGGKEATAAPAVHGRSS